MIVRRVPCDRISKETSDVHKSSVRTFQIRSVGIYIHTRRCRFERCKKGDRATGRIFESNVIIIMISLSRALNFFGYNLATSDGC